ncbi:hypothetical protein DT385_11020 [Pseudomonas syringae]|nr:hypothetical protein EOL67_15770 [Pseudomonas syringae pv. syringae]TRN78541.1 hypothetical protein DT385_11020 [Pseudomonas syringae]SFW68356.1 hypothetical protein SAMN03159505_02808 [Pseudomonas sp. NFACC10-1]
MAIFVMPLLYLYYVLAFWFICKVSLWGYSSNVRKVHVVIRFLCLSFIFYGSELYSYAEWKVACATMAGLHVYAKEPVQGFFYPRIRQVESKYFLNKGYGFVEGAELAKLKPASDQIYRFYKGEDGDVNKEAVTKIQSVYQYESKHIKMLGGGKIDKNIVRKIDSDQILGESIIVQYNGGIIQDLLFSFFSADRVGLSAQCVGDLNGKNIIEEVIPPILSREMK